LVGSFFPRNTLSKRGRARRRVDLTLCIRQLGFNILLAARNIQRPNLRDLWLLPCIALIHITIILLRPSQRGAVPLAKNSSAHNLGLPDIGHNARRSNARSRAERRLASSIDAVLASSAPCARAAG